MSDIASASDSIMTPAEGIHRLGFRRWYERQLIESHVFLVTAILSMIAVVACLAEMSARAPMRSLGLAAVLAAGFAVLCVWSLGHYHTLLARALYLGERSTCSQCGVCGALDVVQTGASLEGADGPAAGWLKVRCRKCSHQWTIA